MSNGYIEAVADGLVEDAILGIEFLSAVEIAEDNPEWGLSEEDLRKAHSLAVRARWEIPNE